MEENELPIQQDGGPNNQETLLQLPDEGELVITSVEHAKKAKNRYLIWFGDLSLSVHEDVMIKYRMLKGSTFNKQELGEIIIADEKQRAYVQAILYLGRKPRTRQEVAIRLREKEIEEGVIDEIINRLEQEGLLNDAIYARQWAQQRVSSQRKGKVWVRHELRQKGINKSLISEALEQISEEEELASAITIGRKKWKQTKGERLDRRRKTAAYLMRRGFSSELVRRAFVEIENEDGFEE
ncbi:RecX family transcriptional regulator [Paenibacillus sediminis]|uniref:Regulatory protein RecX n=1 Tax=Paenibacillus sediminis TaxID=664909 RepID=A0ABS4H1E6_9BACL|nr:RecX family transcriptional regulator [Paenibacillus sediminis]MBP1936349.1 regulatory protein [Paenibacillus sediminis]